MFKNIFKKPAERIFCELYINDRDEWIGAVISYIDFKESLVKVFVFDQYLKNYFEESQSVRIRLIKEGLAYTINGCVKEKILSPYEKALSIKIDETEKFPNYRKNERYSLKVSMSVTTDTGLKVTGLLDNISREGILFSTDSVLEADQDIMVEASAFSSKELYFKGRILGVPCDNGKRKYAVKIIEIDSVNSEYLQELLFFLDMEKNRVSKEFKEFDKNKLEAVMLQNRLKM